MEPESLPIQRRIGLIVRIVEAGTARSLGGRVAGMGVSVLAFALLDYNGAGRWSEASCICWQRACSQPSAELLLRLAPA